MRNSNSGTGDNTGVGREHKSTAGTPRWVKVSGIIAVILVLLVVLMMFIGGGKHGPGRHISSGGLGGRTLTIEHGVQ